MNFEEAVLSRGWSDPGLRVVANPDRDWLRELYDQHRDLVFRYAASRCGREVALDVVADTFVEAARSQDDFDPARGSVAAWLLGIATNRIRRWQRTESRYTSMSSGRSATMGAEDQALIDLPERMDDQRSGAEVRLAVAGLPEGERSAFLLFAVEGLTTREVATALAITSSAAKLRIFRARRRLRNELQHLDQAKESA